MKYIQILYFLTGPEDPNVALDDFKKIDKFLDVNTVFSMHDWCLSKRKFDNGFSTKAELIKPYINSLTNWKLLEETDGENYNSNEESVGLCFYKKISK